MDKNGVGETYEAFKARNQREFDSRHAGRTQAMQQKLLRVHLQHFLLTIGAEVDRERQQIGACRDFVKYPDNNATKADGIAVSRKFASEQKRLAVAREAAKAKRHRSARTIQSFVRRRRLSILRDEEELPSTSVLIALKAEEPAAPLKTTTNLIPTTVDIIPVDPPQLATLPPYEVVIEVVAARDLVLDSTGLDGKCIETELLLKRQSHVLARVVPIPQFVSSFQGSREEIQLQDCSLQFAIDPNDGMRHGIASPQSVIAELSATIIVKTTGGGIVSTSGVVGIPLSLLETPLATQYALYRWFPLEKAHPGHTARGDLRVSARYLMRQTSSDSVSMVPYVNTTNSKNLSDEAKVQQEPKKTIARRLKKASATAATQQKVAGKSFQRRRAEQATGKFEKLKSPVLSLKDSMSSPIGRISRAEALSPPSSPSSVTSSETGEIVDSPRIERQGVTSRRSFPPKRPQKLTLPEEEQVDQPKVNSSRPTFLKRKPYKVVFHKLDWSGVSSKTDSRLPTGGSSQVDSGVAPRQSKTSRPASRIPKSSSSTSNCEDAGTKIDLASNSKSGAFIDLADDSKPGVFIDAATAQRLAALETAMYERCCVTRETASLARFKYQTERKKFVATLQSQAQARADGNSGTGSELNHPPSQDKSEQQTGTTVSDATMTDLWKKLTGDSSGQIYAAMVRSLAKRPTKPIEPTEPVG